MALLPVLVLTQVIHPPPLVMAPYASSRPSPPRRPDPHRIEPPTLRLDRPGAARRDLPPAALASGGSKRVGIAIRVDVTGIPFDCRVTVPSSSPQIDRATCASFLKRARFHPARTAGGAPVVADYRATYEWRPKP